MQSVYNVWSPWPLLMQVHTGITAMQVHTGITTTSPQDLNVDSENIDPVEKKTTKSKCCQNKTEANNASVGERAAQLTHPSFAVSRYNSPKQESVSEADNQEPEAESSQSINSKSWKRRKITSLSFVGHLRGFSTPDQLLDRFTSLANSIATTYNKEERNAVILNLLFQHLIALLYHISLLILIWTRDYKYSAHTAKTHWVFPKKIYWLRVLSFQHQKFI